jgi:hypothetical protein
MEISGLLMDVEARSGANWVVTGCGHLQPSIVACVALAWVARMLTVGGMGDISGCSSAVADLGIGISHGSTIGHHHRVATALVADIEITAFLIDVPCPSS